MTKKMGEILEELRGEMSLRDAAEKSGLSHSYIRDLEIGINRKTKAPISPSLDTLKRLSEAYRYPYHLLLKETGILNDIINSNHVHEETGKYLTKDELSMIIESYTPEDRKKAAEILKIVFPKKKDAD